MKKIWGKKSRDTVPLKHSAKHAKNRNINAMPPQQVHWFWSQKERNYKCMASLYHYNISTVVLVRWSREVHVQCTLQGWTEAKTVGNVLRSCYKASLAAIIRWTTAKWLGQPCDDTVCSCSWPQMLPSSFLRGPRAALLLAAGTAGPPLRGGKDF